MADTVDDIVASLQDVLDRERHVLLAGEHDQLMRLVNAKEIALTRLQELGGGAPDVLAGLRDQMERNQVLAQCALEGVRSALNKVAIGRDAQKRVVTYDETGSRNTLSLKRSGKIERRA